MTTNKNSIQHFVQTATQHLWYLFDVSLFGGKPTTTPIGCYIVESKVVIQARDWVGEDEPEEGPHWCFTLQVGDEYYEVEIDLLDGFDGDDEAWTECEFLTSSDDTPYPLPSEYGMAICPAELF